MTDVPVICILHGDDEYAISEFIADIEAMIGDPSTVEMNTTRIDGNSFSFGTLVAATNAMPFLGDRRMVILSDPLGGMKSVAVRENFKSLVENIPKTTTLVIVIHHQLVSERDKRKGVKHWLQQWTQEMGRPVLEREFLQKHGAEMAKRIQTKAIELGGTFSHHAAFTLAEYVQDNPRTAAHEIEKLLAYVNYQRQVEPDDVHRLTPNAGEGDVFKMVDAIGTGDTSLALQMLHKLLDVEEPLRLFGMVVRQFRLLLLTRELLDAGYHEAEIARQLKTHPFVIRKLIGQVRKFSIGALEEIYGELLDVDEAIKTGKVPIEMALDILITSQTN